MTLETASGQIGAHSPETYVESQHRKLVSATRSAKGAELRDLCSLGAIGEDGPAPKSNLSEGDGSGEAAAPSIEDRAIVAAALARGPFPSCM